MRVLIGVALGVFAMYLIQQSQRRLVESKPVAQPRDDAVPKFILDRMGFSVN